MENNSHNNLEYRLLLSSWLDKKFEIINNSKLKNILSYEYKQIINLVVDKDLRNKFSKDEYFNKSIYIIHEFSNNPWATQNEILNYLNITIEDLNTLNLIVRSSDLFQDIILKKGIGKKYWNSIVPFAKSTDLVLSNKISLPKRIVIFPGVSCMFFCGF